MTQSSSLTRAQSRRLAQAVATGRIGLGILAMAVPRIPLRPWIGERGDDPGALLLARALGGRDLALGLGAVLAMRHDAPVRGWVEAGGLADAGDVFATLISLRRLPSPGRWAVLASAGGAVVAARLASRGVDAEVGGGHHRGSTSS